MIGRTLTGTEIQLFAYCENERQAIEFANHLTLPDDASYELIENTIAMLLVNVCEQCLRQLVLRLLAKMHPPSERSAQVQNRRKPALGSRHQDSA